MKPIASCRPKNLGGARSIDNESSYAAVDTVRSTMLRFCEDLNVSDVARLNAPENACFP